MTERQSIIRLAFENLAILIAAFVLIFGVSQCSIAHGQNVTLVWDASTTDGCDYRLYAHTNTLSATNLADAVVKLDVSTNLTARVEDLQVGQWWFAATALKDGLESVPSNILLVEVPGPPENMRTLIVQFNTTLTNGWHDVGFFRLKIPAE